MGYMYPAYCTGYYTSNSKHENVKQVSNPRSLTLFQTKSRHLPFTNNPVDLTPFPPLPFPIIALSLIHQTANLPLPSTPKATPPVPHRYSYLSLAASSCSVLAPMFALPRAKKGWW